jgi:glycosyltransferase involved in cell wall biosynthesis
MSDWLLLHSAWLLKRLRAPNIAVHQTFLAALRRLGDLTHFSNTIRQGVVRLCRQSAMVRSRVMSDKLSLAFVVQRYGKEVNGGAECLCRQVAEKLAMHRDIANVRILTTCAKDYQTWRNHYAPGEEIINGVYVERFPVRTQRLRILHSLLQESLTRIPHPEFLERIWARAQGPWAPGLIERLRVTHTSFDAIIFCTYLYYPTIAGIGVPPNRRILWPAAHDEPAIYLKLFDSLFQAPEGIAFNSEEERDFSRSRFAIADKPQDVIGCGIELQSADAEAAVAGGMDRPIQQPYLLYLGRISKNKGVYRLVGNFVAFKERNRSKRVALGPTTVAIDELKLVLVGTGETSRIEKRKDIVMPGFVSEAEKHRWLRHAELLLMPSHYESLSLVTLEAWAERRPVLADAACAVTCGHVNRSGGGLTYADSSEFDLNLRRLLEEPKLRSRLGEAGWSYVKNTYCWPEVEARFIGLVRRVAELRSGCA